MSSSKAKKILWLAAPETPLPDAKGNIPGDYLTRYHFATGFISGSTVLDVGCGLGYGAELMARMGAKSVLGLDASGQTIRAARSMYEAHNLQFQIGKGVPSTIENASLDTITAFEVIEHMDDPGKFLADAARTLKPGGVLLVSTPNVNVNDSDGFHSPFHVQDFGPEELISALRTGFASIELFGVRRKPDLPMPKAAFGATHGAISRTIWAVAGRPQLHSLTRTILRALPRYVMGRRLPWVVIPTEPWWNFEVVGTDVARLPGLLAVCKK